MDVLTILQGSGQGISIPPPYTYYLGAFTVIIAFLIFYIRFK